MKTSLISLLCIVLLVAPAACAVTVTDDDGTAVAIAEPPQRIISLAPSNTEILYALGLGDRVVGVTDYCNYPPDVADKATVGGYSTVNVEKVVALHPDLVVAAHGNTGAVIDRLRGLGVCVIALNPPDIDGILRDIELVGRATGTEAEAATIVADMRARMDAVQERHAAVSYAPSVAHVVWHDPIYVSGANTFQDEQIARAGGRNAFGTIDRWGTVTLEQFITANPEIIIVNSGSGMGDGGENAIYDFFLQEARLKNLDAVKNGRVYIVDSDIIDRGGPRIVDSLEIVARAVHPGLYEEDDPAPASAPESPGFGAAVAAGALGAVAVIAIRRLRS
ncbi:MAG: cobalamin-binding protein [Methanomicrobiaceae archaeon]|nr:cobalamin-binding protein [Methanomicrobiaceae archaeon]